ncbi:hypothetical protein BGZ73_004639 [Actinomortierella ambigua]|nr:hypothetical protein BGZ73_004639 [Actinomortierella ambigua]
MADATPATSHTPPAPTDAPSTDSTPVKRGRGRPKGSFKVKRDENGKPIPGSRIDPSTTKSTTMPATTRSSANGSSNSHPVAPATKRKAQDEDDGIVRTGKRGRPPGTGKKQILARKIKSLQAEDEDSDEGVVSLKVIIERCTTCTQYKTNSNRIFRLVKQLYPDVECVDVPVAGSKGFEIFVIKNGGKKVQVWSGKAHAPPKRLAFPESELFLDLFKAIV